jgi:hypothetical protein
MMSPGWTERSASEMRQRFAPPYQHWLTTVLFASDTFSIPYIHGLIRATCYRHYHQIRHGMPTSLIAMLQQEQKALRFGDICPTLTCDDLTYTNQSIRPYLTATDYPTQIAVLWGDEVARHNGFPPLGFSHNAGLAWACATSFLIKRQPKSCRIIIKYRYDIYQKMLW